MMDSVNLPDALMLNEIRDFLIPKWIEWGKSRNQHVTDAGENMCRFTSAFLEKTLGRGWKYEGGLNSRFNGTQWVDQPMGFLDIHGKWNDHCWVQSKTHIIDLTAAQFGLEPIVVTHVDDSRYAGGLNPMEKRESMEHVRKRALDWHKEWQAIQAMHVLDVSPEVGLSRSSKRP